MKFMRKTAGLTLWDHKVMNKLKKKNWNFKQFLNLFRIIGPIGRITLKEWSLTESQTTFWTTGHMEKEALGRPLKRWSETVTGHLA
jgi:hypothetical protein